MPDPGGTLRDEQLVARVRAGDAAAASALVERHFRAAYAVALALLGNPMDAEDVCQDAFVRALERIDECRKPDRFVFWLLQIVRNHAHNARDRRRVRSGPDVDTVDAPAPDDARQSVERSELRATLLAALEHLTPEQREVVLLKDLEGWDHRAIARALGISEGMSRQHAFNARHRLRELLGPGALEDHLHE